MILQNEILIWTFLDTNRLTVEKNGILQKEILIWMFLDTNFWTFGFQGPPPPLGELWWRAPHFALKYPCNPPPALGGDHHLVTVSPPPVPGRPSRARVGDSKEGTGERTRVAHGSCIEKRHGPCAGAQSPSRVAHRRPGSAAVRAFLEPSTALLCLPPQPRRSPDEVSTAGARGYVHDGPHALFFLGSD